ncbi:MULTISPECIES: phasin family protein [Falsihalocynthiibacter]|uniref:Phasin n=1 Tax=Falsihalocynthiibacter arcticus TaxID=1579316 RepID=A0A126UW44_9RHOB|nr:phasin family protein [Falsihalocynthiibacter arcticus]AML49955.1 Phasin [Falsihalocynthiibacter arcticus]
MTQAQDFTKIMQDMVGAFPVDTTAFEGAFKNSAALGDKMSKVALTAAEKSNEISTKWTKETLAKLSAVSAVKTEPADYSKALTEFASSTAEMASENLAAFAEIAKKVQAETVELMLAAGKDITEETNAAVNKATADVTKAAKAATK